MLFSVTSCILAFGRCSHPSVLRWIGNGCITISGFELGNTTKECTVQIWYV